MPMHVALRPFRFLAVAAALLTGTGCAGLQLTSIKMTQQKPSNVAVYFKVQSESGEPVGGLTAEQFRIYEDGQLVSQYESKQTILNPEVAAVHYTLLLVDMSGSVSESGNGDTIVQAVGTFTERVEKQQKVAIYAFDGSPDLTPIVPFTDQAGSAKAGVQQLATFKPKDPSTNLNGAVVKALDELDNALGKASQPLKFGTVVVFTDGTDRANRVPADEMRQHIREKPFDVYAIGLGAELKEPQLKEIGKSGTAMAADKNAIVKAFDDVGGKVEARTRSYYLLSYCSPSRAGKHEVRIEAVYKAPQGKTEETGSLRSEFDATGFMPGCDPKTPPTFDVTRGDALAPPPEAAEKKKDDKKEEKKEEKKETKPARPVTSPPPPRLPPPPATSQPATPPPPPPPPPPPQDFNP
ncbi:MAG TPA: VWA domain-containing protein [Polyangiaceae bacterium]